jgi:hypothetical protein
MGNWRSGNGVLQKWIIKLAGMLLVRAAAGKNTKNAAEQMR